MERLYHQRDNEIFYQGKRVAIVFGDSEHEQTNLDEAYSRAKLITKLLNKEVENVQEKELPVHE